MVFIRQIFMSFSVVCSGAASQPQTAHEEHTAFMQATISADGAVRSDRGDTADTMQARHRLEATSFQLDVTTSSGKHMFSLEEHFPFGDGIQEYTTDKSFTLVKPSFRTFRTARPTPLAVAQVNSNGHVVVWASVNGELVEMEKTRR